MATIRMQVAQLHAEGLTGREIAARIGRTPATVSYHLRRLEVPSQTPSYDWSAVQAHYDAGNSVRGCLQHFGMSSQTWHAARLRGDLVTRPHRMPIEELLAAPRNRRHIVSRLVKAGLKERACELCSLREWAGKPLVLQLHHINGVGDDNRLENLQLLCPNCHSQTENWGGRNSSRAARASRSRPDRDAA